VWVGMGDGDARKSSQGPKPVIEPSGSSRLKPGTSSCQIICHDTAVRDLIYADLGIELTWG
jgi:hypothetical protein